MQSSGMRIVLGVAAAAAVALLILPGCSSSTTETSKKPAPEKVAESTSTALATLPVARSAVTSVAPDARLLVVSTSSATAPSAIPAWSYIFGSSSTGKTYLVVMANGAAMPAQEVTGMGYSKDELAALPNTSAWKLDSDAVYGKAFAASKLKAKPGTYTMGFETYKSKTDTSTVQPFVWRVRFFPANSGESTTTIDVNATTGATAAVK